MSVKYKVYRNARNEKSFTRIKHEVEKYGFKNAECFINTDFFSLYNKIIEHTDADYALVIHDDVYLPFDIEEKIALCVERCGRFYGEMSWGICGNAGVRYFANNLELFLKDPSIKNIAYKNARPIPSSHVDGNAILLNLKALREMSLRLPEKLSGFHFYDLILTMETYKKGLLALVDSSLFVYHKSVGNKEAFYKHACNEDVLSYLKENFENHTFQTVSGPLNIDNFTNYAQKSEGAKRKDYYSLIYNVLIENALSYEGRKTLYIAIRTRFKRISLLRRSLENIRVAFDAYSDYIDIKVVISVNNTDVDYSIHLNEILEDYASLGITFVTDKNEGAEDASYPRVRAIRNALKHIPSSENTFVWFVDDDDFVMSEAFKFFPLFLQKEYIMTGDIQVFEEEWNEGASLTFPKTQSRLQRIESVYYRRSFDGDNRITTAAAIYPANVLKNVLEKQKLLGDYYEDYAIFLFALKEAEVRTYPLIITGMSYHGDNTVLEKDRTHWNYSYATFISEAVNEGVSEKYLSDLNLHERIYLHEYRFFLNIILKLRSMPMLMKVFRKIIKPLFRPLFRALLKRYRERRGA